MRDDHNGDLAPTNRVPSPPAPAPAPTGWEGFGYGPTAPVGHDEQAGQSLWSLIDDRLRGRWRWAILLAAVLGVGLAAVGYRSAVPMYESIGVIRVVPTAPVTLDPIAEGQVANFTMFVNTQVERLRSRRVLENAMNDEQLASLEWSAEDGRLRELQDDLVVVGDRNSELIYVQYESESPTVAQTVVNAVIKSYDEIYGRADGAVINRTLDDLTRLESDFQRDLNRVRSEIRSIMEKHGMEPAELQRMKLQQLDMIEQLTFAAERALRNTSAARSSETESAQAVEQTPPQILNRLEQIDPELLVRRRERDEAVAKFESIALQYRESATAYRIAERAAEAANRLFDAQYERALDRWEQSRFSMVPGAIIEGDYEGWPPEALIDEIKALNDRRAEIVEENQSILSDLEKLRDRRELEQQVKSNLERTKQRIASLVREERNVAERISIEQEGYRPLEPSSDGRAKRAALGLVLGCGLSFGLFFLLGTVDRRAYGMDQLRHGAQLMGLPPVLGVLPDLRGGSVDPEKSDVAAHCLHQIRNQIEARRVAAVDEGFLLVVSSPFQGDGKTSIVLSLGWSYAVAGYKCLVVDCDMVGRSMSRQLGLSGREGLKESIVAGDVGDRIVALPVENLDALPVGVDPRFGPEAVRKDNLGRVLRRVRDRYDIVIIDTGPLLGALESTPASAVADGVILSVRRGRARARLEEAVGRLTAVGASCIGVILNCATPGDCYRSVSEASLGPDARAASDEATVSDGRSNPLVLAMEKTTGDHIYTER